MYKVGICDDGEEVCIEIENVIASYTKSRDWKFEVLTWDSGEKLKKYLDDNNSLDILFLDIYLKTMSGVDIAQFIRKQLNNYSMKIIFISSHMSYAMRLFQVQPLHFLMKPLVHAEIERCLDLAVKLLGDIDDCFVCKVGRETHYIPYRSILYFESDGRKIHIVTENVEKAKADYDNSTMYDCYGRMNELASKIQLRENFVRVHQSYIVHTTYIKDYQYKKLLMSNGVEIPISKKYQKIFRNKLMDR